MLVITDIDEIKRLTRRGQRKTVIAELRRRGIPATRPNFGRER